MQTRRVQSQSLGTTTAQSPSPLPAAAAAALKRAQAAGRIRLLRAPAGSVAPAPTEGMDWQPTTPATPYVSPLAALLAGNTPVDTPAPLDFMTQYGQASDAAQQYQSPLQALLGLAPDAPAGALPATRAPLVPMASDAFPTPAQESIPVQSVQQPVQSRARVPRPVTPIPDADYRELPAYPSLVDAPTPPKRDVAAEQKRREAAMKLALLGPALGAILGVPIERSGAMVPSAVTAALQGANQAADDSWQDRVLDYKFASASNEEAYRRALGQYGQEVASVNAHNRNQAGRVQQAMQQHNAADREETARRKEASDFLDGLADLDPETQRRAVEAARASGDLDRLGVDLPVDAAGNFVPLAKAAPAGTLTAEQKIAQDDKQSQTESLRNELRTQYGLLTNSRITKAGAEQAGKRIAQIQAKLGYGTGADVVSVGLDEFTPEQRASIKIQQDRLALQKQNAANLQDYRSQTAEQRQQKAQAAATKSTKAAGGSLVKAFNQNQRRISSIERELQGNNATGISPERIAALEYERAVLSDQQVYLSPQVPALTPATRTRGALPGGKAIGRVAATMSTAPASRGRVGAALAPAETRKVTVDGASFTVSRKAGK